MNAAFNHWRRGILVLVAVGLAAGTAVVLAAILCAIFFIPLEIFWHRADWQDIEARYYELAAGLALIVAAPMFLGQMVESDVFAVIKASNRHG